MNCLTLSLYSCGRARHALLRESARRVNTKFSARGLCSSFIIPHSLFVFREHVAEERALGDGVVESLVRVGEVVEPVAGHVAFDCVEEVSAREGHCEGLDVERVPAEGGLACEAGEVPADEHEV